MPSNESRSFADLKSLGLAGVGDVLKRHVTDETKLGTLTESFRSGHRETGKAMAAAKELHADAMNARTLPKMSFRDYHKGLFGQFPNNHAEACSCAFLSYVVTGLITEADYDNVATDWLELASTIVNAVLEGGGDVTSDNVKAAADILKVRPSDGARKLRGIKNVVKPKKAKAGETPAAAEGADATKGVPLNLEQKLHHVAAELAYAKGTPAELARLMMAVDLIVSAIERNAAFTAEVSRMAQAARDGKSAAAPDQNGPTIDVESTVQSANAVAMLPAAV